MVTINWDTPIQVESCNETWHDVIFHKKYRDRIMLVYEDSGVPTTIYAYVGEVRVRNKPIVHKKTLYLVLFKSGACSIYNNEEERDKHLSEIYNYELRDIDLEWES